MIKATIGLDGVDRLTATLAGHILLCGCWEDGTTFVMRRNLLGEAAREEARFTFAGRHVMAAYRNYVYGGRTDSTLMSRSPCGTWKERNEAERAEGARSVPSAVPRFHVQWKGALLAIGKLQVSFGNEKELIMTPQVGFGKGKELIMTLQVGFGKAKELIMTLQVGFGKAKELIESAKEQI